MKALISGQAGVAIIDNGARTNILVTLDDEYPGHVDARRTFAGCTDVHEVNGESISDVRRLLNTAWACDRALQLTLFLLDPIDAEEERTEYALCIEDLIKQHDVAVFLESTLYSAPMPELSKNLELQRVCSASPQLLRLLEDVLSQQESIQKVHSAFEGLPIEVFDGEDGKFRARAALVKTSAFRELTQLVNAKASLKFARLSITTQAREYAAAIARWISALDPSVSGHTSRREQPAETPEHWDDFDEDSKSWDPDTFNRIMRQQAVIVGHVKERNLEIARRLTNELIREQRTNSTSEQIAMTLCRLATKAKAQEVPELHLEWSEWATRENPSDHWTHGIHAEALIRMSRYAEAYDALQKVEETGDPAYADNRRAAILAAIGKLDEARAKFLATAVNHSDSDEVVYSYLGAAEVLRDMGQFEEALSEYVALSRSYPLEHRVWEGLAATHLEMGNIEDALRGFGVANTHERRSESAYARIGRAKANWYSGRIDTAISIYDEVLRDFPNNQAALLGRAEALRDAGRNEAALKAFDKAIERCPYSVGPISGKAFLLKELRRLDEASELFEAGERAFPDAQSLSAGAIGVLRSQGKYIEALKAADSARQRFPFNAQIPLLRADLLQRLSHVDEALAAYDEIIEQRPHSVYGRLGKASLLLRLGRLDEAHSLMPNYAPRSQTDWSFFLLRGFLEQKRKSLGAAITFLIRGLDACPFGKQRGLIRSAIAKLELDRGNARDARRIVERAPDEVSNVIALHVFAASHRPGLARQRYNLIKETEARPEVILLAEAVARRSGLIGGQSTVTDAWVRSAERDVLLLEAA